MHVRSRAGVHADPRPLRRLAAAAPRPRRAGGDGAAVRLARRKAARNEPVALPEVAEMVVLAVGGGRIPARVIERDADSLAVAITVPTRPLGHDQLAELLVEFSSPRGRVRLAGTVATQDPSDPDVVRIAAPRSVEVLPAARRSCGSTPRVRCSSTAAVTKTGCRASRSTSAAAACCSRDPTRSPSASRSASG